MIVGLCGKAGAGKDYVCEYFQREIPRKVRRVAFADEVRREVSEMVLTAVGLSPTHIAHMDTGTWSKPYTVDQRRLLQLWGTEVRRAEDPDYWVRRGLDHAAAMLFEGYADVVVFTDVRYANEAEAIRDEGGIVLEVTAPEAVRRERLGGVLPPDHASEVIDFPVDGRVANNGPVVPYFGHSVFEKLTHG